MLHRAELGINNDESKNRTDNGNAMYENGMTFADVVRGYERNLNRDHDEGP